MSERGIRCRWCAQGIEQKTDGKGHRARLYCSDAHKQAYFRNQQRERKLNAAALETTRAQQALADERVEELQRVLAALQERLDVERRYRTDTQVRAFKSFLRKLPQPRDSDFLKRFLADTRLPPQGSRALYEAKMRQHGYSDEDRYQFQEWWKAMLLSQA